MFWCVYIIFSAGESSSSDSSLLILSMTSPECNVLCRVISFLVLWSLYLSFPLLVDFNNGPDYLRSGITLFIIIIIISYLPTPPLGQDMTQGTSIIIIIIIIFTLALAGCLLREFSQVSQESSQASITLLSILADLNNAVVLMVSFRPPIFNSSSSLSKHLETVPSATITIGITVTIMLNCIFSSLARSPFSLYLIFTLLSTGMTKSYGRFSFTFSYLFAYHYYVWSFGRD